MRLAFTGHKLDRADHVRADPARLAALATPEAKLLRLDGLIPNIGDDGALRFGRLAEANGADLVFLGLLEGEALFGAVPPMGDADPAYARQQTFAAIARLGLDDLALYGGARSLLDWHARHRFCAQCGQPTQIAKGGWQRDCPACKASHFPRTDPVTIMLVEHSGRLLMGRNSRFPERRYSALAGFIEPGETIEEAVAREVLEEAGVRVREVRYVMNQPWPFPSQLMIGCHCMAEDDTLTIDYTELADACWFTRAEVAEAMEKLEDSPTFIPPPPIAVAWHLIDWWLKETA